MRVPSTTFRDELKAYQQRLPALTPENDHWKGRLAHAVIARWIDHVECETIWTTLRPLLKVEVTPSHFIAEILLARNEAEQLNIIVSEAHGVENKMAARKKRHFREERYYQLADEDAFLKGFNERRARVIGREKTGPRVGFMKRLSGGFVQWCGQPLDNVVRVLTEITFGEPITIDAVRAARSPRARGNRGTRAPK